MLHAFVLFKRLVSRFRLKRVTVLNTLYVHVYFINGFKKCATLSCRRWMQKSRKSQNFLVIFELVKVAHLLGYFWNEYKITPINVLPWEHLVCLFT